MTTINIAWRNLWRSKLRSLIIIAAIAIGLWGAVFISAFLKGMMQQRLDASISIETSNIQIHRDAFLLDNSVENGFYGVDSIHQMITRTPNIRGISTDISSQGLISNASLNFGVVIHGIEPEDQKQTSTLYAQITDGQFFSDKSRIPIVIGHKMAKKLNASIGDKVALSLAGYDGEIVNGAFIIDGIYRTFNNNFDVTHVYVLLPGFTKLIKAPNDYCTGITISTEQNQQTFAVQKILQNKIHNFTQQRLEHQEQQQLEQLNQQQLEAKPLLVQSWKEIDPTLELTVQTLDYFSYFFIGIVLVALAFGIVNTMIMVVMERKQELGMMMAIGMNKKHIFQMILWETLLLSFVGATAGIILAVITILITSHTGIDLSMVAHGLNAFGYESIIYPEISIWLLIGVAILVFITALIASIFPTRHAIKESPADAMKD